jgi:hypothetical protein
MVGDGKAPSDPSDGSGILQVHPKNFLPLYAIETSLDMAEWCICQPVRCH